MSEGINITNGDVLGFYADKGEKGCELTKEYLFRHPLKNKRGSNPYVTLIEIFQNEGRIGEEDGEYRRFYQWLVTQNYSEMLSLSDLSIDREVAFICCFLCL